MATSHAELAAEQAHVDRAYERLDELRAEAEAALRDVLGEGRGGTHQFRAERDVIVRTSLARLDHLDVGDQPLCFGRIDLATENRAVESFNLGRIAVSGADLEPLVVDWRAPVAEPFYRATGRDPMGLVLRRHLAADGRLVVGLEDERFDSAEGMQGAVPVVGSQRDDHRRGDPILPGEEGAGALGDGMGELVSDALDLGGPGALLASLSGARTGHLRDIVATIQLEQDEIIRAPLAGILVVQGGPGTGKTAVALHRAAYLLYTHRFPLERQGVLVVGPNPIFLRYISQVLPSLGETGVTLSTIGGLVHGVVATLEETPRAARLKGDARMATVIARAVLTRERPLRRDLTVPFGTSYLRLSREDSRAIVAAARRRPGTHNARRRFVTAMVVRKLAEDLERRRSSLGVQAGGVQAGGVQAGGVQAGGVQAGGVQAGGVRAGSDSFARTLRRTTELRAALDRMWPLLSAEELLRDLFGYRALLAEACRGILSPEDQDALHRERAPSAGSAAWSDADLALVDEARMLLGPLPTRRADTASTGYPGARGAGPQEITEAPAAGTLRGYGHIVVDEAQGLSPMQLRVIARRSLSGSMTLVGDLAQATGQWAAKSWDDVTAHLPATRPPRLVELTVSYRTPAEVLELSSPVLGAVDPTARSPRPVRRSGVLPAIAQAAPGGLGDEVARRASELARRVAPGTVAVIVPRSERQSIEAALKAAGTNASDLSAAAGMPGLPGSPLGLVAAEDANGLEFDGVVVVEPASISEQASGGLRALYVALTRPTKALVVVHERPLPACLGHGVGTRRPASASK